MDVKLFHELLNNNEHTTLFGYALIRDALLPDLIGDNANILYWSGKKLAREFLLTTETDLPLFFKQANWGDLKKIKNDKKQQIFKLDGAIVTQRIKRTPKADFLLEAGFIAETIQNQRGFISETIIKDIDKRKNAVTFLNQLDPNDPIDPNLVPEQEPFHLTDTPQEESEKD
ncbi:hypothetical protein FC19_GL001243 [Liquorilactobacillus aquaticus DSM 21051]|uniref:Hydrocarbon binding protein n=1 Tax=Liquorilactobacillus aquaticus DSM 21051 TaxID=1423725 RepID=A0A0R2CWF8_9LACO|nr:YslB family protein [Liquorilactobacillus aquaticus]KRM95765.1 hypothetical protein FC19_GL001243 [Liquorilactobacillus aquaticus DSM 21051]